MKCVVTGGAGFVGGRVVSELLARGYDPLVYDRACATNKTCRDSRFIADDIRNFARLREVVKDAECIFHLSGVLGTHELFATPREAIDINVNGALNVLLASKESGRPQRIFFPAKPNEWNNVYSVTAQAVEKLGYAYRDIGIDVRMLRLRNVYGPGQKVAPVRKVVPEFIRQALRNRPLEVFGDGTQFVELAYVDDVAKAIIDFMACDRKMTGLYELITNIEMTVVALARLIITMTGSKSPISLTPMRMGECRAMKTAEAQDVREILGELMMTPLEHGMQETIAWYRRIGTETPTMIGQGHE